MKKILPSIFIFLILVNIFAPFSFGIDNQNNPIIKKSVAEAKDVVGISLEASVAKNDTTITPDAKVVWYIDDNRTSDDIQVLLQKDGSSVITKTDMTVNTDDAATQAYRANHTSDPLPYTVQRGSLPITGLSPNTTYHVTIVATQTIGFWGAPLTFIVNNLTLGSNNDAAYLSFNITTNKSGDVTTTSTSVKKSLSLDAIMPPCGLFSKTGTVVGCAAQLIYYVLFIPTSYIFALTGQFFDFTFHYSVSDSSYRSPFVLQGWGIVRDFCNIFFIFVLLYIAFRTILGFSGGHGPNTKQLIINVVIIGLLINFSLFAAQVIIDSSNILARVFYNSDAIKITESGANGVSDSTPSLKEGPNGEIPLSAAIVNKVNPQNLIINGANNVSVEDSVSGQKVSDATINGGNLGAGAFILITLLAVAVNVTGIIVFLSVGMIFIARVIGLWLAMIFVPLAFFSYTVPAMQGMSMVGWKHWWPETLKLAFLAPVFMFFLYLIIAFLQTGLGLINTQDLSGIAFIVATVVPFAFIMVLLWKAKDLAKDMSGKLGQSITGGVATIGGLALGGAALGGAMLGRNLLGRGMAAASRTPDAMHYGKEKLAFNQKLEAWENGGKKGAKPKWEDHAKAAGVKTSLLTRLGGNLNAKQMKVNEVDHARHEVDAIKEKAGLKGVEDYQLSGVDKEKLAKTYTKEKKGEIEADIRKGAAPLVDSTGQPAKDRNGNIITGGESGFKAANRGAEVSAAKSYKDPTTGKNTKVGKNGELTDEAKKEIEDKLNVEFNAVLKTSIEKESNTRFSHLQEESSKKISGVERVFSRSNKGSYDARNLSQTKADKREGIGTKMTAGLIAGIAMGVRTGLKTSNINHGSGQNDFLKDIGHTITEALKSAKVSVKVEESHGKSSDDHGGGGHH